MTPIGTCSMNTDISWDAYREQVRISVRAPRSDLQAAMDTCRSCPALAWCQTLDPIAGTVQAGIIHDLRGETFTTVGSFLRQTNAKVFNCADDKGTTKGYATHRSLDETPCDECLEAHRAQRRAQRKRGEARSAEAGRTRTHCINKHRYTSTNTVLDPAGRRVCVTCVNEGRYRRVPALDLPKPDEESAA